MGALVETYASSVGFNVTVDVVGCAEAVAEAVAVAVAAVADGMAGARGPRHATPMKVHARRKFSFRAGLNKN